MTRIDLPLIAAEFVFDGGALHVPARLGVPREDQLRGTSLERLAEIAGRVCYDSLGKGRSSADYHKHILEVRHLSVLEHVVFTVEIGPAPDVWLPAGVFEREKLLSLFLNRPGVFVRFDGERNLRVTLNARSVLEWERWTHWPAQWSAAIRHGLLAVLNDLCPQIIEAASGLWGASAHAMQLEYGMQREKRGTIYTLPRVVVRRVDAMALDERWVTLLLCGSRGFSHELVRHGDFTAISQRSTRYVDESESPWVVHPLTREYLVSGDATYSPEADSRVVEVAQEQYRRTVDALQGWLEKRGVDKHTARKQARGAARGYLGNALYTEVVFSASLAQWRRMIVGGSSSRATPAADAEIRAVFVQAFEVLKRHVPDLGLDGYEVKPSPDGIGQIVEEMLPA